MLPKIFEETQKFTLTDDKASKLSNITLCNEKIKRASTTPTAETFP